MKKIDKPIFKVREVFLECISTVNDQTLQSNLNDCVAILENAETDFESKFLSNSIHQIGQVGVVKAPIGKNEMTTVYDYRMLKKETPRREYYNKLISSAAYGKCPLCSVREVDTLDHYLPKSKYPIYAVTPINLIPACFKCNKGKSISYPTNSMEQTLNPYYDNIENDEWLDAEVLKTSPISFRYFVNPPAHWQQILKDRVTNHFESYHLNELFSSHANEELRGTRNQLVNLYNNHPDLLIAYLEDSHNSRLELGKNSWQAVMYRTLFYNTWFCYTGVLL